MIRITAPKEQLQDFADARSLKLYPNRDGTYRVYVNPTDDQLIHILKLL